MWVQTDPESLPECGAVCTIRRNPSALWMLHTLSEIANISHQERSISRTRTFLCFVMAVLNMLNACNSLPSPKPQKPESFLLSNPLVGIPVRRPGQLRKIMDLLSCIKTEELCMATLLACLLIQKVTCSACPLLFFPLYVN